MSSKRYLEEFKIEAVKQVTERGHSAPDVAKRLGVSQPTLYEWIKRYSRGCKNFCVNGQQAGNCHIARSDDDRSEESRTPGVAGQPVG